MSYKSNTNDGVKLLTLPGLETIQNKTGDIAAGLRKLRPFVLLNGTKLKGGRYTNLRTTDLIYPRMNVFFC